jgi:hypothetical protein
VKRAICDFLARPPKPAKETQTMPRKSRSNEEIIDALDQILGGEKVNEVYGRLGVSEQTFHRWTVGHRGTTADHAPSSPWLRMTVGAHRRYRRTLIDGSAPDREGSVLVSERGQLLLSLDTR